jgi:hypothetical protein
MPNHVIMYQVLSVDQPTACCCGYYNRTKCGPANAATEAVVTVTVVPGTGTSPYEYSFDGANFHLIVPFKTFTVGPVNAIVKDAKFDVCCSYGNS